MACVTFSIPSRGAGAHDGPPLIEVEDLRIDLNYRSSHVAAVEGVSFRIDRGETFGLVGESGCGKSITALALIGLLRPPLSIGAGAIRFDGREIQSLPAAEQRALRGNRIAMIFQEPMTALNPVSPVGRQIAEMFVLHQGKDWRRSQPAGGRGAGERPHPRPRAAGEGLPAPALGRHAPARDDRHRARLRAGSSDRRRADHRARRHRAGGDHRADAEFMRRARHGHFDDQPRSRPGRQCLPPRRRHVCRPHCRGARLGRYLPRLRASLYARPGQLAAAAGQSRRTWPDAATEIAGVVPAITDFPTAAGSIRAARGRPTFAGPPSRRRRSRGRPPERPR